MLPASGKLRLYCGSRFRLSAQRRRDILEQEFAWRADFPGSMANEAAKPSSTSTGRRPVRQRRIRSADLVDAGSWADPNLATRSGGRRFMKPRGTAS